MKMENFYQAAVQTSLAWLLNKKFSRCKQKCLTGGIEGNMITPSILYVKYVWAERVAWKDAAESCRMVQGNSWELGEVHSASSVLKPQ